MRRQGVVVNLKILGVALAATLGVPMEGRCQGARVDVVYLANGSIIRGEILEQVPNKSLKIRTRDGSIFVYEMKDVTKLTRETDSQSPSDSPAAAPTPPQLRSGLAFDDRQMLGRKDPTTATVVSLLVTGGGHIYAGETGKGLLLLTGSIGSVIAGMALSDPVGSVDCYDFDCTISEPNNTPLYVGVAASLGLWLYGLVDAGPAARRTNMSMAQGSRVSISPTVAPSTRGGLRTGIALRATF